MLRTRLNIGVLDTKGQVTPKSIIRSGRNSNLFEILFLSRSSAKNLIKIQLKRNRLCSGQSQIWLFFGTQGQIFPSEVWSGGNLNLPQILWLSWLPASFKMIRSNVKALSSGQHFLHYKSMGKFFIAQWRVTLKWIFWSGPKSNSCKILWLSLLTASLTIQSKNESPCGQHFPSYMYKYGSYYQGTKGQVTPKSIVRSGRNLNSYEILSPSRLSASLMKIWLKLNRLCSGQGQIWCFFGIQGQVTFRFLP